MLNEQPTGPAYPILGEPRQSAQHWTALEEPDASLMQLLLYMVYPILEVPMKCLTA